MCGGLGEAGISRHFFTFELTIISISPACTDYLGFLNFGTSVDI